MGRATVLSAVIICLLFVAVVFFFVVYLFGFGIEVMLYKGSGFQINIDIGVVLD